MPAQIIALSSTLVKGNNVVAVSLSKGGSQVILFALEVVLTNTPDIQLTEGEASAVQQDPKTQFPPSRGVRQQRDFLLEDGVPARRA